MVTFTKSSTERIIFNALNTIFATLSTTARIGIAFSGGLDSTVLLDIMVRFAGASRCIALHVHHGLSPNADQWCMHCAKFANSYGINFDVRHVQVVRNSGMSLEAQAREARYRALNEMCVQHHVDTLSLAQHADDQAETVLLQLLRGTGLAGLAAMAFKYSQRDGLLRVRPLLHILRAQLEQYAQERALQWIDDETNTHICYTRNALRHKILPTLAVRFPGFRNAFARTAAHAASAQRLLDVLARIDFYNVLRNEGQALSHETLLAFDDDRASNLLRYWMRTLGLPAASNAWLANALRQLRAVRNNHRLCIVYAGQTIRCYRGLVFWEQRSVGSLNIAKKTTSLVHHAPSTLIWRDTTVWRLPQWYGVFMFILATADDPEALPETVLARAPLIARSRTGGERMRIRTHGLSRTLKNLFQEHGVPIWKRDIPLIYSDDILLFVPLIGTNHAALMLAPFNKQTRYFRIEWRVDPLLA